jgi:hypothetical protein
LKKEVAVLSEILNTLNQVAAGSINLEERGKREESREGGQRGEEGEGEEIVEREEIVGWGERGERGDKQSSESQYRYLRNQFNLIGSTLSLRLTEQVDVAKRARVGIRVRVKVISYFYPHLTLALTLTLTEQVDVTNQGLSLATQKKDLEESLVKLEIEKKVRARVKVRVTAKVRWG